MILPVTASWVGTVLAFYFGRENFESANQQVQEIVQQFSTEQPGNAIISNIMKKGLDEINHFKLQEGQSLNDVLIQDVRNQFKKNNNRLPILSPGNSPLLFIHKSRIDDYVADGNETTSSLQTYIEAQKKKGFNYGLNKGFIVVSQSERVKSVKEKMESITSCQDIIVTRNGGTEEPMIGWVSNSRLARNIGN